MPIIPDSYRSLCFINSFTFPLSFSCSAVILSFHFLDLYHIFSYFPSELVALFPISALKDKDYLTGLYCSVIPLPFWSSSTLSLVISMNTFHAFFFFFLTIIVCCCLVTKSCLTLCNHVDSSMQGSSVLHYLPEFIQIHVH